MECDGDEEGQLDIRRRVMLERHVISQLKAANDNVNFNGRIHNSDSIVSREQ